MKTIDYCDVFYDVAMKHSLMEIQYLVNKSLRIAYRRTGILNRAALHRKAKLNKLKDRRKSHLLELAFKLSLIQEELDVRNIITRRRDQRLLSLSRPKKTAYSRSLRYRLACAWNALHLDTRAIEEGPMFTKWNKKHFYDLMLNYTD